MSLVYVVIVICFNMLRWCLVSRQIFFRKTINTSVLFYMLPLCTILNVFLLNLRGGEWGRVVLEYRPFSPAAVRGRTSGAVYLPCVYSHARWRLPSNRNPVFVVVFVGRFSSANQLPCLLIYHILIFHTSFQVIVFLWLSSYDSRHDFCPDTLQHNLQTDQVPTPASQQGKRGCVQVQLWHPQIPHRAQRRGENGLCGSQSLQVGVLWTVGMPLVAHQCNDCTLTPPRSACNVSLATRP